MGSNIHPLQIKTSRGRIKQEYNLQFCFKQRTLAVQYLAPIVIQDKITYKQDLL